MYEMQVFNNPEFGKVRATLIDGEPWFVGKDVAEALEYGNTRDALRKHVDAEDRGASQIATPSGKQQIIIINESGVYSLILSSKLPKAKQFKHWVTSEVLPTVCKQGCYLPPEMMERLDSIDRRLGALERQGPRQAPATQFRDTEPEDMKINPFTEPGETVTAPAVPSRAVRARWMRTMNEKLSLLCDKFCSTSGYVLHLIYGSIERKFDAVLEEERMRCMELYGMDECSVLEAVYRNPSMRKHFEICMDANLAPENRGW